jgi:integrase
MLPGHHQGGPSRNKRLRYPADPPTVEEIVAVLRCAGDSTYGLMTRALIVLLWRAGLRISEALALAESDLERERGGVLVRRGKGASAARSVWTSGAGSASIDGSRCASWASPPS